MTRQRAIKRLRDLGTRVAANPAPATEPFNHQTYHPPGSAVARDWCVVRIEMNAQGTVIEREEVVARAETQWAAEHQALTRNLLEKRDAIYVAERRAA